MKIYIEAIEQGAGENLSFIKEEVIGTQKQAEEKVKVQKKSGKTYKYRKHFCYHDEEPNKPCTTEEI